MNEEQNTPNQSSGEDKDTSKVFLTTNSSLQSQDEFGNDKEKHSDDYYEVDNPKKEVHSTIGDGEMHNEGLVGEGNLPPENPFTGSIDTDEQDKAELRDSQG